MANPRPRIIEDLIANGVIKRMTTWHRRAAQPDVLIFATPRGGSTWLMELIWSQPGFRACTEPFDLRNGLVRRHLGIGSWHELYDADPKDVLVPYLRRYQSGHLRIVDPLPTRGKYYRWKTNRIVFKIIHGGEGHVRLLSEQLGAVAVILIRHPIAVSLSRKVLPRLEAFLESSFGRNFSSEQLEYARGIANAGTDLEKGVLDWTLQNAVLLAAGNGALTVSYEQLVLEPEVVIPHLARRLLLPEPERMLGHVDEASDVTRKSDDETRKLFTRHDDLERRERLINKWRDGVSEAEEERCLAILDRFGIDAYRAGTSLPTRRLWLGELPAHEPSSAPPTRVGREASGGLTR